MHRFKKPESFFQFNILPCLLEEKLARKPVIPLSGSLRSIWVICNRGYSPPFSKHLESCLDSLLPKLKFFLRALRLSGSENPESLVSLTSSVSRVCDQRFVRFEQAGWQRSQKTSEEALHHSPGSGNLHVGRGGK